MSEPLSSPPPRLPQWIFSSCQRLSLFSTHDGGTTARRSRSERDRINNNLLNPGEERQDHSGCYKCAEWPLYCCVLLLFTPSIQPSIQPSTTGEVTCQSHDTPINKHTHISTFVGTSIDLTHDPAPFPHPLPPPPSQNNLSVTELLRNLNSKLKWYLSLVVGFERFLTQ